MRPAKGRAASSLLVLTLLLLPLAGCEQASTGAGCAKTPNPQAAAEGPPTAIMRDVGGGPAEYLIGVPGGTLVTMTEANGQIPPVKVGDRVWFTVMGGTSGPLEVRTARLGECSARVTDGTIGPADPHGNAIVVGSGSRWRMLDTAGNSLADLEGIRGTWTPDGHLVEPSSTGGLAVYDDGGHRTDLTLPAGATTNGAFGPGHELITTDAGLASVDIQSGAMTQLPHSPTRPTNLEASPDAAFLSYFDLNRNPQLMRVSDGAVTPLPSPGPATGITWSRDGTWVAVQSPYGGEVVRAADARTTDIGPLIVISW